MTIRSDLLIMNCQDCYAHRDYSVVLQDKGNYLSCPQCNSRYTTKNGNLVRL
ncbi:hypothetical protein HUU53_03365 [Candidatus Micrarchaeota archaeon]|nr:hypothetical protein [Candidatus Micrarchaeota archaeon]